MQATADTPRHGGSRPADTALSVLLCATGDLDSALAHYQEFKRAAVEPLPHEGGVIRAAVVRSWVRQRCGPLRPVFLEDNGGASAK